MSILDALESENNDVEKMYGVAAGIVTNNKDELEEARIKIKFPWLSDNNETDWVRIATLMAGNERGSLFLPEVGDEVLVAFEQGDINRPYVIGALWNGNDKPPEKNSDGENNIRIIKSRSGHIIKIDDTKGKEKIEIVDKTEKNMIIIDAKDNKISLKSDKDIEISAPNGTVTIDAKDIEVKSSASTKIEASAGMDLKASSNMNIKGSTVNIN